VILASLYVLITIEFVLIILVTRGWTNSLINFNTINAQPTGSGILIGTYSFSGLQETLKVLASLVVAVPTWLLVCQLQLCHNPQLLLVSIMARNSLLEHLLVVSFQLLLYFILELWLQLLVDLLCQLFSHLFFDLNSQVFLNLCCEAHSQISSQWFCEGFL